MLRVLALFVAMADATVIAGRFDGAVRHAGWIFIVFQRKSLTVSPSISWGGLEGLRRWSR